MFIAVLGMLFDRDEPSDDEKGEPAAAEVVPTSDDADASTVSLTR